MYDGRLFIKFIKMQNTKTKMIDTLDRFERKHKKLIKEDGIWYIVAAFWLYAFLSIVIWGIFGLWEVKADSPKYTYEVCDTNKCKARIERINNCKGDVKCAVKLTQEASYDYLYKEISELKEISVEGKRNVFKEAVDFTLWSEGLRLEAYFDWYANDTNRWSIWNGTVSYPWEVITIKEAVQRRNDEITPMFNSIPDCFNANQKIALTSYIYNTWGNQMKLPYHIDKCRKKDVKYIMNSWGWNKELIPRRIKELSKYNS